MLKNASGYGKNCLIRSLYQKQTAFEIQGINYNLQKGRKDDEEKN